MSLDLRALYPYFHAETSRHASSSSSPRATSAKGSSRKDCTVDDPPRSPSRHATGSSRPAHYRTGKPQQQQQSQRVLPPTTATKPQTPSSSSISANQRGGDHGRRSSRSMPPLAVSACAARPSTSTSGANGATPSPTRAPEVSFLGSQPATRSTPLASESPEDASLASDLRFLGKTRSHVLRGGLPVEAVAALASAEKTPLRAHTPSRLVHSLSMASLSNVPPLQELVQCDARPRSRYARREIATPIQPLPTNRLSQSASSPALSRIATDGVDARPASSSSAVSTPLFTDGLALRGSSTTPQRLQSRGRSALSKPPTILSWSEQDTSSFFLTEIDAKDAADQWKIARALARGAHLLYAKREFERAVACFADALAIVQQQLTQQQQQQGAHAHTPLLALLHHHMGVAFHEDGQAKWSLMMQKKTLELAQQCGDAKLQARALKALGVLFLDRDEPQKALDCQQQALTLALDTGDAELEARVYANLGNLAAAQQQLHHAIACHERDLAACSASQIDSAVGQARAHRNLALVYAKMSDRQDARLDHELRAARLEAANTFETDMRRHAGDVVGNVYLQLAKPDAALADMVARSVQEVLTAREDDDSDHKQQQDDSAPPSPQTYMI